MASERSDDYLNVRYRRYVGVGQVGHGGGWASIVGFFGLTKINVVDGGGGGVGQDGLACRSKFLLECVYFSPQLMLFFFGA